MCPSQSQSPAHALAPVRPSATRTHAHAPIPSVSHVLDHVQSLIAAIRVHGKCLTYNFYVLFNSVSFM